MDHLDSTTHFAPTVYPDTHSMTTDTLFSHYNQPQKPLPGPMYLIIEGHSKVKKYGGPTTASVRHEPKFVPVQSTIDPVVTRVVNEDDDGKYEVRHLHYKQPTLEEMEATTEIATTATSSKKPSVTQGLLSLLDTSFGDFFSAKEVTTVTAAVSTTEASKPIVGTNSTTSIQQANQEAEDDFDTTEAATSLNLPVATVSSFESTTRPMSK